MAKTEIFVAGVGGLGSLTASRLLGEAATRAGLHVVGGEIHGMAQRGGIVESTVRIGEVYGPIIGDGQADVLIGFEPVETLRALHKANKETVIITSTRPIVPATVSMAGDEYPDSDEVIGKIRGVCGRVYALDATEMAREAGNPQAAGSVLLGVLAGTGALPFDPEVLKDTILDGVPAKAKKVNALAFDAGVAFAQSPR